MFLLSQNDENQSENGSKNSKIRLRARPPAEPQKKMLQTKKLRSKSWKTRVFFTFRLPILDGRVHEQVSSVLFFTVFFEGERHDLSKTGGFGRKMPPPPGKPVTFYECHPEDHAPAPSVRADFLQSNARLIASSPQDQVLDFLEYPSESWDNGIVEHFHSSTLGWININRHISSSSDTCLIIPLSQLWFILISWK